MFGLSQAFKYVVRILAGVAGIFAVTELLTYSLTPELERRKLGVGSNFLVVEVADHDKALNYGMMFRFTQKPDEGMLFVYPTNQPVCMWMKFTFIPLSVAFIREDGFIVNTASMSPLRLTRHCSSEPVRYALEVPQGWFDAKSISTGARVSNLPLSPAIAHQSG
jgi:uncharacterized protein